MASPDPHGQVALMLCESLLHLLVEGGLIPNDKALEAIAGLTELAQEIAERDKASDGARNPALSRRELSRVSAEDLAIMTLIDRQYLARSYYGWRRMAA